MGLWCSRKLCPGIAERTENEDVGRCRGFRDLLTDNLERWCEVGGRLFEKECEEVVGGVEGVPHV